MQPKLSKYSLPGCLKGKCETVKYSRWLLRKASAHVRRDRKRNGKDSCTVGGYRVRIHQAVMTGGDRDFYTGEPLDWSLIGKFENIAAKAGRSPYKKRFAMLPTVDHTFDEEGKPKFVICSWKVNDAKCDLTLEEFYELCEMVLKHRASKR
jgi:hypothetical protein